MTKFKGRKIAFDILNRVCWNGGYSNILLSGIQDKNDVSREDVSACVNLVYGVLRNITLIDEVLKSKSLKNKLALSPPVMTAARMAGFELLFMTSVPPYAVVSYYVEMAKESGSSGEAKFLNACLRKVVPEDAQTVIEKKKTDAEKLALQFSQPLWFVKEIIRDYTIDKAREILGAANEPQPSYYRLNSSRTDVHAFTESYAYKYSGLQVADSPSSCFCIEPGKGGFPKSFFNSGTISPQDRSTQFVPYFLNPSEGESILDLCCGSGVKTLQIAEMTNSTASITAVDIVEQKLKNLASEMARLNLSGIKMVIADIASGPELGKFDKVLLDAPCSGSGTLRRRPEIRMRLSKENVIDMNLIQDKLLDAAAMYVNKGGTLGYSTCSILKKENENRIFSFLKRNSEFRISSEIVCYNVPDLLTVAVKNEYGVTFLPHLTNACGSFVSIIKRVG